MKINTWIVAAALTLAVGGITRLAPAEDILDQALGGGGDSGAKPAKADGPKADPAPPAAAPDQTKKADEAPKPTHPSLPELVSPDAAKTVDDQDLLNKLTGKSNDSGGQGGGPVQKLHEVMDRMGQAQTRLEQQKDPGLVTQETQRRIVTDLNVVIEYLKKQQQQGGGQGQGQGQQPAQQRTMSQGQQQGQGMGGSRSATDSNLRPGEASTPGNNGQDIHQVDKMWGGLPPGDRQAVAHGASEHFLPEYQDMIKKYYEALAEIGKSPKGE